MVSVVGWGAGAFIYVFYHVVNAVLQFVFYARPTRDGSSPDWKIQPQKGRQFLGAFARIPFIPWLALLAPSLYMSADGTPRRPRWALMLATLNALMAACFAGAVGEAAYRGATRLYWHSAPSAGRVAYEFAVATTLQCVLEYYWHVLMHRPWFYRHMHKIHHSNKAPEPFDDMLIHPVEAFGYYCILYSPPFVFDMHVGSFALYMTVMGLTGIFDHSGIRIKVPGLYNTEDHDVHHSKTHVNFAFPFPFMDMLHGTFEGEWLGKRFIADRNLHKTMGKDEDGSDAVGGASSQ